MEMFYIKLYSDLLERNFEAQFKYFPYLLPISYKRTILQSKVFSLTCSLMT